MNTGIVYHNNLKALRYQFSSDTYKGAFTVPANAMWGSWCPDGLYYIGPIKDPELPLYSSKPHFLDGDKSLLEGVEGLEPSSDKHESYIDIQPHLGVNLEFAVKIQLNVRVNISSNFRCVSQYSSLICWCIFYDPFCKSILKLLAGGVGTGQLALQLVYLIFN